jgi:D-alanine-D-alanine ligase-like ATP-grasp enzyme
MNVRSRNPVRISGRPGAPVVVLAHGFGCDQNMWRLVVPALERDFTVVLFDHVGATQVREGDFYDADAKLDAADEGTVTCTEANLPAPVTAALNDHVVTMWEGLGCHGMARVDFIVTRDCAVCALEVNTTPGMSYGSNFITAASLMGWATPTWSRRSCGKP